MKLNKGNWELTKIGTVCQVLSGGTPSRKIVEYFDGDIPWITPTEISKDRISLVNKSKESLTELGLKKSSARILPKGTILLTSRATIGLIAVSNRDLATNQGFANFICDEKKLYNWYLAFWLLSKVNLIKSLSSGTTFKEISKSTIRNLDINLPPIEEQILIASLFQSIEAAIEQVGIQEKNFKALWLKLIDEFVNERPSFGDLLMDKKLQTVAYSKVTEKIMRRIDPISYGIEKIVAGENLESEDFKIRIWQKVGEGYLGPAFHVLFKPGDILYGSRRTYLKKVAFANFEGVCANTTYVIRAKEKFILQDLLKHIMLSDRFTKYSIDVSKGSTNPYINWKDLDNFTFQIPDIETQKDIIKVLDDVVSLIENLKTQQAQLRSLKQNLLNEIMG